MTRSSIRSLDDRGTAVFRSGWGPDARMLIYQCGPSGGREAHAASGALDHFPAAGRENSFKYMANGRTYIDGYEGSYRLDTRGGNTLSINGGGLIGEGAVWMHQYPQTGAARMLQVTRSRTTSTPAAGRRMSTSPNHAWTIISVNWCFIPRDGCCFVIGFAFTAIVRK